MKLNKKALIALVSAALLLTFAVSGTVAYLVDVDEPVVNEFKPAKVTVDIPEEFDGESKSDVKIQNTGDIKAYVRATYIVTWQNGTNMIPAQATEYDLVLNTTDWVQANGMYYWHSALEPNNATGILIKSCAVKDGVRPPAEGYYLNVEIIAQAIQAEPTTAVVDAWKVTLDSNNNITGVSTTN